MLYNKKFTIIANWKMYPEDYYKAQNLLNNYLKITEINKINLIVALPDIYLKLAATEYTASSIIFSSQNISNQQLTGAFTGEISAAMIKNLGIHYSIIGHSECRDHYKETNKLIAQKVAAAIKEKLNPIVCVGETKADFIAGKLAVTKALIKQLKPVINMVNKLQISGLDLFIAYEPIWAIGSGSKVGVNYINQVCKFINNYISSKNINKANIYILYGGSVNPDNASKIKKISGLAGILVGGAALDPIKFTKICAT